MLIRALNFCVISLLFSFSYGVDFGKQQQINNLNTEFLSHEGGLNVNGGKNDPLHTQSQQSFNQNNGKRDYISEFPQLRPPNSQPTVGNNQNSGKRDYVAPPSPTWNTPKPQTASTAVTQSSGGKRDYVAPQFPTLKPVSSPNVTPKTATTATLNTQSTGAKRDYVAPQYPTVKPAQGNNSPAGGKVKDLINFYDRNGNQHPQVPSYSSIAQGPTSQNTRGPTLSTAMFTQTTPKPAANPTKPFSYSNAVSGSKPTYGQTTVSTPRPSSVSSSTYTTSKPKTVLPSSIVNRNKNTQTVSSGPATDLELQTLSEELLLKDVNNAAKYVTVNYQEKTTSQSTEDKAPLPLLTISPEAWNIPTIQKLVPLLDNYERDTLVNEYVTPQERNEENAFMDAIMSTSVIRHLMNFLKVKGYVSPDPRQQRDFLKQLWFSLYSRGKGKISSSGFEHVFVSEVKNGDILGLHNWIYFSKEESANRINYLGYLKYTQLGDKGVVMKLHFNQQGSDKPVNSMLIGTSPELEIALYTVCFLTRADNDCKLKLANNDVNIVTHTFRYRSKNLIGSAYPQLPSNYNY